MTPNPERLERNDGTGCSCQPGTEENGWHEKQCANCAAAQQREWAEFMTRLQVDAWGFARKRLVTKHRKSGC